MFCSLFFSVSSLSFSLIHFSVLLKKHLGVIYSIAIVPLLILSDLILSEYLIVRTQFYPPNMYYFGFALHTSAVIQLTSVIPMKSHPPAKYYCLCT